jgi:hypothetical protein
MSNPSLKRSTNGRPPGPGLWCAHIFTARALASCRRCPLSSNVRRHNQSTWRSSARSSIPTKLSSYSNLPSHHSNQRNKLCLYTDRRRQTHAQSDASNPQAVEFKSLGCSPASSSGSVRCSDGGPIMAFANTTNLQRSLCLALGVPVRLAWACRARTTMARAIGLFVTHRPFHLAAHSKTTNGSLALSVQNAA